MKPVRIIYSAEAQRVIKELERLAPSSKKERMILRAIYEKVGLIKQNTRYGNAIQKEIIEKYHIQQDISNLYRVELPLFWRMLYTVKENEVEIIALILDVLNHKEYDRRFGYKGR